MKGLSVKQPWANLIASGRKTIETRTWSTGYRGRLLIVSSKKPDIAPAGAAVCMVALVGCRHMRCSDEPAACCGIYPGAWAWLLEDVEAVEPVPIRGQLGIYDVDLAPGDLAPASDTALGLYTGTYRPGRQRTLF
jgi:hypothetical protein